MENNPQYTADSFIPFVDSSETSEVLNNKKVKKYDCETFKRSKHVPNNSKVPDLHFHCPWKKKAVYCAGVIGLHEEINDFYKLMSPTAEEADVRLKVIEHITLIVHSLWPEAKVEVFGSFRTGLYLPSSDIDIVITGKWRSIPLNTLSEALLKNGIEEDDITIIANATVPIVKMIHTSSKIRVDISFNASNGGKSAKFIKNCIKEYPPLPKLVLVLKQFLIHRGLNEVYSGGMNSYCLTLLVISFLQAYHKPNCYQSTNVGTLLMEFFEHYGVNFNYERVSIHFDNGGKYQPKSRDSGSYLTVEDPFLAGRDVAKGTYLMQQIKGSFQNAFHTLHRTVIESMSTQISVRSYLELILKVEEEVLTNRKWIHENYSFILRSISRHLRDQEELSVTPIRKKEKKEASL